jgi:amino acid transporter
MATDESKAERLDRELEEMLQELRVALPGVQILFAFLLIVPFNNRFEDVTTLQRNVYVVALLCAFAAVTCFISPTAYHRIRFREHDKERLIFTSTWLARIGLVFLAVALTASVFFITDFLFERVLALAVAGGAAAALGGLWFALPIGRKLADPR